jgi:HSP20 family protein
MLNVWDPFADLNRLSRAFERDLSPRVASRYGSADFAPSVDVHEDKDALVITAELPGFKRDQVEISLDGEILTLKGERKFEKEEGKEGKKYHRVERSYGMFVRSFQLPSNVDADKATANLTDGVLTLRLPKKDIVKGRKIEVNASH